MSETPPSWPPPALQTVNGVLLQGQALTDTAYLVAAGIRAAYRDDGISASGRLRRLADHLATAATAATSASGHADVRAEPVLSTSLADEITTTEAATMLGTTERQMRRIAPLLGGRKTSAGWLIRRGAVTAHLHERNNVA